MSKNNLNYVLFFLLAVLWSGSFIAIKIDIDTLSPFFAAMLRVLIAFITLIIIFYFTKRSTYIDFSVRWKIWLIGLFSQGFPFAFLFWGERLITPGLAGILNGTVSIWVFCLSLLCFHNTRIQCGRKIIGLNLGIIGIVIIFWPALHNASSSLWGSIAVLCMAVSYAIGGVLNQYLFSRQTKINFYANLYHQHWSSLIFLLVISLLFEPLPSLQTLFNKPNIWFATFYMGIFSTAIAWMIYYYLIREWDAVRASTVLYVVPILTLVWDFLFLHNCPQLTEIVGAITILGGVILLQTNKTRSKI